MWCGGGAGSKGGALAAGGDQAAEHGFLFRAGAGAGEAAAQQRGTAATEASSEARVTDGSHDCQGCHCKPQHYALVTRTCHHLLSRTVCRMLSVCYVPST